jgi:hypothetical protein
MNAGGGGAGQGGALNVGGAGMRIDAGPGMVDAGGSQAGSTALPPDCPVAAPIPAPNQIIAIQSINVDTSEMVLRNVSQTAQTIQLGRQGWQWCSYPRYWNLVEQETEVVLAPGETLAFVAIYNMSGPVPLYAEDGEMAIYTRPGNFPSSETMEAFVAWGEIQAIRETLAVEKGWWTFSERIQIRSGHAGFIATGPTDRASGYTSVRAACLVAPPNP